MIRVNLDVTPQQAIDIMRGIQRAVVSLDTFPEEERRPQVVMLSCPEIGWHATAYAYDIVGVEPRFLFALDISKRVDAKALGTTRLRLMHMCNQYRGKEATVFCLRRLMEDDEEKDRDELDSH